MTKIGLYMVQADFLLPFHLPQKAEYRRHCDKRTIQKDRQAVGCSLLEISMK